MDTARILIVDDDAILAARLEETLLQLGYQPTGMAATGEDAVSMAMAQRPDAILMDIRLRGEMTGIQAAAEIHQSADIPIIYLTAYTEETLVQQASLTDAYAYLAKPVRDRELRASLEMALYKHETEKRLQHLNRVLRAVRNINQLITREHDAQRLLEEACQILVRTRGYLLVWIGRTEPGDKLVHPVASAGRQAGYLEQVEITWDESQTGQGPTGSAIREKRPVICRDVATDPNFTPWREAALKRGFAASATIPIVHEQSLLAVLNVYGDRVDLFDDEEVDLLAEVARDLAFALAALEEEVARKRTEAEIQRLASFPQLNPNPVLEVDGKGVVTFQNRAVISLLEKSGQLTDPSVILPQDMKAILARLVLGESAMDYREVKVGEWVLGEDIHLLPQFNVVRIYARDITERKHTEEALLESEQKFKNVFDNSAIGKSITALDGRVNVNQALCDMLGYTKDEISRIKWQGFTHPDDIELTEKQLALMQSGEQKSARFIKRYIKKDGSIVWGDVNTVLQRDQDGAPQYYITAVMDITERKLAEQERLESEQKFRNVFDNSAIGKSITLLDGTVNFNQAFCDMLGYSKEEFSRLKWQDFTQPDDIELTEKQTALMESGEQKSVRFIKRYIKKDGSIVWVDVNTVLQRDQDGAPQYYITAVMDISERKQAEEALRSERDFAEGLIETAQTIVLVMDTQGRIVRINPYMEEISGYALAEVQGLDWFTTFLPERDRERTHNLFLKAISSIQTHGNVNSIVTKDGHEREIEWNDTTFKDAQGNVVGLLSTGQDITERKQAEEALKASEKRFRDIADNSQEWIWEVDAEGKYTYASPMVQKILGYTPEEILQKYFYDLFHQEDREALKTAALAAFAAKQPFHEFINRNLHKNGQTVWLATSGLPLLDEKGNLLGYRGADTDITERKQAEENYRTIFDNAPVGIFQSTPEGRYLKANQALADIYGYASPEEMLAEVTDITNQLYVDPAERLEFRRWLAEYGEVHGDEVRNRRKDGSLFWITRSARAVKNAAGEIQYYEGFLQDISERKHAEQALEARLELREYALIHTFEELFRKTLDLAEQLTSSKIGFFHTLDADQKTLTLQMWSTNTLANMCTAEAKGAHYPIEQAGVWVDCVRQRRPVIHNDYASLPERKELPKGHASLIRELVVPIFHDDLVVAVLGVGNKSFDYNEKDIHTITDLANLAWDVISAKQTEQALHESEARYRNIFEGVQDAIFVESPTGEILDVNQRACEMFGYSHAEFLTKTVTDLVPPGSLAIFADNNQPESLPVYPVETHNIRANGEIFPVELTCRLQEISGKTALLVVLRDITERKRAEEALRAALRDKEVLLRELYHRTNNNMQVISSLLNMEADRCGNDDLKKILRDMDTRILAMSLVHEKLYQSKNLASIDLKDYLYNLAALILESYNVRPDKVRLSIQAESVTVPIESAIPCGLLVNEIISNSLKHAFPGERTGEIKIQLTRLEQGQVLLEISDNGVGIPAEIDLRNLKSLGMRIIFGIAGHQFHAQVQVDTTQGVCWRIRFSDLSKIQENETISLH
jgi:PAS domain S-box-containing protein